MAFDHTVRPYLLMDVDVAVLVNGQPLYRTHSGTAHFDRDLGG
jgi:hypothetical protein